MPYTCPKCGMQISDGEGKSQAEHFCEHCGQPTGPLQDAVEPTPAKVHQTSSHSPKNAIKLWHLLLLLTVFAIFLFLMLPKVLSPHINRRSDQCLNNQKQIALALLTYESEKGHLPPAYIADKNGKPMHSWRVLILPYLDRNDLYQSYDFNEPWDGPHNRQLADKMPSVFACPSNQDSPNCTGYALLVGPHTLFPDPKHPWSLNGVTSHDGAAKTLLLVEAAEAKINWLEPRDLNVEEMSFKINQGKKEISSHHPSGVIVSYCDGHVSFLPEDIKPETLKALITVDGHEPVNEGDY